MRAAAGVLIDRAGLARPMVWLATIVTALALAGCARDVVLKPAVIGFNADAHRSVDAAEAQYDAVIVRLNRQTADFIARNPECGLALDIVARSKNPTSAQTGPYCLTQAEQDALPGNVRVGKEKLPIASRETFATQFRAIHLLLDYTSFLARYADDPRSTAKADIEATASAVTGFGNGLSELDKAFGGAGLKEFAPGGAVSQFAGAIGDIAEQLELIVDQANDVAALEKAIKTTGPTINEAMTKLAASSDAWNCATIERRQIDANAYALAWSPKLPEMTLEARREVADVWVSQKQVPTPGFCVGGNAPAAGHGDVAEMLLGVRAANIELIDLANHKYTPAQRKAIAEATLSRLGTLLSRVAAAVPVLP